MGWRNSPAQRVYSLLIQKGMRAGIDTALDLWARRRLSVPKDVDAEFNWILSPNRPAILTPPTAGPLRINWILPEIVRGSGGLFNIFRTIFEFEQWNHQNRIYVVSKSPETIKQANDIARNDYFPITSPIEILGEAVLDSDATIATSWETAYSVRSIPNTARKFYFVQDFEPYFFAKGSLSEFATQTYQWGFYGLTAGKWIGDVLQNEFQMQSSAFSFSYDRSQYAPAAAPHPAQRKKRVLFYARPRTERRGFELGILALKLVAQKLPDTEFVLVGFPMGSVKLPFAAQVIGVLDVSQLGDLYRSCDVALVLSHTNASLLPLELMACGCAVVSNTGPNVEWLINDQIAALAPPNPEALSETVAQLLNDDHLRNSITSAALKFVEQTDWTNEARAVEAGIYKGLGLTSMQSMHHE